MSVSTGTTNFSNIGDDVAINCPLKCYDYYADTSRQSRTPQ